MKLKDFYFDLDERFIARFPSDKRDESKLMVVNRKRGEILHKRFKDILDFISEKDFLVINNSKVIPARFFGSINNSIVEMLITKKSSDNVFEVLTKPAKKFKKGIRVYLDKDVFGEVIEIEERGKRIMKFNKDFEYILKFGYAPLPPYIKRKIDEAKEFKDYDLNRYQTVYSKNFGSIAAPTAGLHFTKDILKKINSITDIVEITLNVGEATFQKINVEDIDEHKMGREEIIIPFETRNRIFEMKKEKNLIAVGTTSVRSLETLALYNPEQERFYSELFIKPGFKFRMVDKLITNFHLPESSLFILVCAFAGIELMKDAYRVAIENDYRFFSYGDSMLIL